MFERLLVAVDGTEASWRAAEVAQRLATWSGSGVELVHVAGRPQEAVQAERRLSAELAASPLGKTHPPMAIDVADPTVPATLARRANGVPGTVMVMATHARGRSGALFGSVATDVLDATHGPVVMVGPHVDVEGFDAGRRGDHSGRRLGALRSCPRPRRGRRHRTRTAALGGVGERGQRRDARPRHRRRAGVELRPTPGAGPRRAHRPRG